MKEIEFHGKRFGYDDKAFYKWSVQRGFARAQGIERVFTIADAVFEDADAVAAELGDDVQEMAQLIEAIVNDLTEQAKN